MTMAPEAHGRSKRALARFYAVAGRATETLTALGALRGGREAGEGGGGACDDAVVFGGLPSYLRSVGM